MCLCRTKAHFSLEDKTRILTLDPVTIEFATLNVTLQTRIYFEEGSSNIRIERTILEMSDPAAKVAIHEYMVGCYGTTEYPEDMTGVMLSCKNDRETKSLQYAYQCREESLEGAISVDAVIPPIHTRVSITAQHSAQTPVRGYFKEGYAFSPMYTLGYESELGNKEVFTTWLNLARED